MGDSIDQRLRKAFWRECGQRGSAGGERCGATNHGDRSQRAVESRTGGCPSRCARPIPHRHHCGSGSGDVLACPFRAFANYWGAPLPHPSNTRQRSGAESWNRRHVEFLPLEERLAGQVNAAFPGQLQCLPHESPAVLVLANVRDVRGARSARPRVSYSGEARGTRTSSPTPCRFGCPCSSSTRCPCRATLRAARGFPNGSPIPSWRIPRLFPTSKIRTPS